MSGNDMSLKETCACGATLSIVVAWSSYATNEAAAWRKNHRHEFPPLAKPARVRIPLARRRA